MENAIGERILVVDDDQFLQENVVSLLRAEGYIVDGVTLGSEALTALGQVGYDLIILDLGLPDMDGIAACRRIRVHWTTPILMLTARTDALDKVMGLETGADDYLTKPFNAHELVARVRAQLRRSNRYKSQAPAETSKFVLGEICVDYDRREVKVGERTLDLTSKEYEIVVYLTRNEGRALSREQIFEHVWGYEMEYSTNSLDVHMYRLRRKIEENQEKPRYLHTLRGYGYKLSLVP